MHADAPFVDVQPTHLCRESHAPPRQDRGLFSSTPLEYPPPGSARPREAPGGWWEDGTVTKFPPKKMPRGPWLTSPKQPWFFSGTTPSSQCAELGSRPTMLTQRKLGCVIFALSSASPLVLYHLAVYPTWRRMGECPVLWGEEQKSKQLSAGQMQQELQGSRLGSRSRGVEHIPCSV